MTVNVVTEGKADEAILKSLLREELPEKIDLKFFAAEGKDGAVSYARSLLATRPERLALVVDADKDDPSQLRNRLNEVLWPVANADRYEVFVVAPALDATLLDVQEQELAQALGIPASEIHFILHSNQRSPRQALEALLARAGKHSGLDAIGWLANRLAPTLRSKEPLFVALIAFVTQGLKANGRN